MRRRFLRGVLHPAAAELHMVGEPQGPGRPQRFRGRLPRPRQHRSLRPQRAAADGRAARTGRRDGVDGAVQPEHARAVAWCCCEHDDVLRGLACSSSWSTSSGSPRPWIPSAGASGRDVGRGGRLLLRRAALPGWLGRGSRCVPWSGCSRCARPRWSSPTSSTAPRSRGAISALPGAQPGPAHQHRRPAASRGGRSAAAVAGERAQAAPDPGPDARRGEVPRTPRDPLALAMAPGAPLHRRG